MPVAEERWKLLTVTVPGSRRPDGATGDDRVQVATLPLWRGQALVAACADGAGSAKFGGRGAEVATRTALRHGVRLLRRRAKRHGVPRESELQAVNAAVYLALQREAARMRVPVHELSTTLLLALVTPLGTVCSQIGDGVMVVHEAGGHRHVFWPDQGEYANTTHFATEQPQHVHVAALPRVDGVALMTDGLQSLALDYANRRAFAPFFSGLFGELARGEAETLQAPLRQLLTSPAVRARTDDDIGLVLALRVPA